MSEAAQQRKARKKAHKKFMKIMAGPQFTKLAHSVGIPASVHGVKFSVIMTRVALALDPSCTNVDETLRKALGKTEEAFEKRWPRSRHVLVERKPNATVKPESACRRLGSPHKDYVKDDGFYESREWRELRYFALQKHGPTCQCCGASSRDGARIHVDHIVPRYKNPALSLVLSNLQILCEDCNIGKGAWDQTDWRSHMKSISKE